MYSVNVGNNFVFIKSKIDFLNEVVKGVKKEHEEIDQQYSK